MLPLSTHARGHTLVMCCEWLAVRHAERAHFYIYREVEERGRGWWVYVYFISKCMCTYVCAAVLEPVHFLRTFLSSVGHLLNVRVHLIYVRRNYCCVL